MKKIIENHNSYYFHIWFIDGNHENFDILNELKESQPNKKIIDISSNIHYITRGTKLFIKTDEGVKNILFCGGADSVDKFRRIPHLSWWENETITQKDIDKCLQHNEVDYIITHCCPFDIFKEYSIYLITRADIDQDKVNHSSEMMLNQVKDNVKYNKWFFGHYHVDIQLDEKHKCFLNDFVEL